MSADVKDLVERLRARAFRLATRDLNGDGASLAKEAATALEAQAEEIARLVAERDAHKVNAVRRAGEKAIVMGRASAVERERAEEWRRRREAEASRDTSNAAAMTLREERDALKLNVHQLEEFIGRREDDILSISRERNVLRAEVDRLRASLELAANRLDRLALEDMPLKADALDWGLLARAALYPTQGGE